MCTNVFPAQRFSARVADERKSFCTERGYHARSRLQRENEVTSNVTSGLFNVTLTDSLKRHLAIYRQNSGIF